MNSVTARLKPHNRSTRPQLSQTHSISSGGTAPVVFLQRMLLDVLFRPHPSRSGIMIHRFVLTAAIVTTVLITGAEASRIEQRALLLDVEDGRLDRLTLLQAALACSAPTAMEGDAWAQHFQQHAEQCARQAPKTALPAQRAELIFRYLHDRILTGVYDEDINCVRDSLRSGRYNCITSTVLYLCLCRQCGLEANGVAVPNHVLVKLNLDREVLVETTHDSFHLLDLHDQRIPRIRESRDIGDVALLGRFFYNRAIQHAQQGDYAKALEAANKSCRLDPLDGSARNNLLATMNNWSIALCAQGNYERASFLVKQGLVVAPDYRPFIANDVYVHHRWISALRREGRHVQADELSRDLNHRHQHRSSTN